MVMFALPAMTCLLAIALVVAAGADEVAAVCAVGREAACGDQSSFLQTHAHAIGQASSQLGADKKWFMWKTSSSGRTCDEVCGTYGTMCVPEGFATAKDVGSTEIAKVMATGAPCPRGNPTPTASTYAPFAPYLDLSRWGICKYAQDTSASRCDAVPEGWAQRMCPCSAQGVELATCKQLTGRFCAGTELACDCNYCDDFKNNDQCANACRVMNGYTVAPTGFNSNWRAVQNLSPSNAPGCDCQWMAKNSGLGDDCKQCDSCALQCRLANRFPKGTCR